MAADIGQELAEQILKRFNEKYKKAQLFGSPISETLEKLKTGEATFRDADMYAVEVGTMLSDSMIEVLKLEDMPNETLYYNIARKTIEPSLQKGYNLISNVASAIQDDYNRKIGIGMKAAVPEFNTYRSDNIIEGAVKAKTQESLNASVKEPVETFCRSVVDDTKKKNAEIHAKAGLDVKVSRTYDRVGLRRGTKHAEVCDFCDKRKGTDVPYKKALSMGMFQRHNGCGCLIEYTSKKGEKTYSTSKNDGFKLSKEEAEQAKNRTIKNLEEKNGINLQQKEIQLIDINRKKKTSILMDCEQEELEYRQVKKLRHKLGEQTIIEKVGKLDDTPGSCASVALAYAGNKAGYDVLDFRGGKSLDYFCKRETLVKFAEMAGGDSCVIMEYDDLNAVKQLLSKAKEGKEYILASGRHASIIKKGFDRTEFLELQYPEENYFKEYSDEELVDRFGLKKHTIKVKNVLVDCSALYRRGEFRTILGYLNTR